MDLGGFVEIQGNTRTIGFSNCERYIAKGTRGVSGVYKIPTLDADTPNNFLTKLFEQYNQKSEAEVAQLSAVKAKYEAAMKAGTDLVHSVTDSDTATSAAQKLSALDHALTSKDELRKLLADKVAELGLKWNKDTKAYEKVEA